MAMSSIPPPISPPAVRLAPRQRRTPGAAALALAAIAALAAFPARSAHAQPAPSASVPGDMGEKAKVDQNGAFSFTIPIEVPPGIAGMQPHLSLEYSSQQQNGIVGVGWTLNGLTSVQRGKRIRAVDGVNGTIGYDGNDRFTYKGQRLIVTAGTYTAPGSVYHTEVESWRLVSGLGSAGAGPQYFTVRSKDGRVTELGNTSDSRIVAQGRADVRSWNVNKITDSNGNAIVVTYTDDPLGTGKPDYHGYPSQIAYTVNGAQQANRFVRFRYEARPDVERTYIGGSKVTISVRLSRIQVFVGASMVSDYRLAYEAGSATARSRLLSVTRYASDAADAASLSPAQFAYAEGALAFSGKQPWLNGAFSKGDGWGSALNPVTLADVNGDGFLDIVGFKSGVWVALGGSASFAAPTQWINDFSGDQGWNASTRRVLADVNGDGLADIVGIKSDGVWVAVSTASAFTKSPSPFNYFTSSQGWTSDLPIMMTDVNGDQITDIVGIKNRMVSVALGSAGGVFSPPTVSPQPFGQTGANYQTADVNGDGNSDLMAVANNFAIDVALSTGTAFDTTSWTTPAFRGLCGGAPATARTPLMLSDANGDGLADVVAFCSAVYVTLSSGQGFVSSTTPWNTTFSGPNWSSGNQRMLTDVNGDGLADLVGITPQQVIASVSNGQAFLDGKWNNASLPWGTSADGSTRFVADANGDGLMDMVGIGAANVYVGLSAGPVPDMMTSAVRASGAHYQIAYAPLSDSSVYSQTGPSGLAQFQNFGPLATATAVPRFRSAARLGGFYHVVKTLGVHDNQAAGDTAFNYQHQMHYQNGELDLEGRGWLGFAAVTTDNLSGAKRTVTQYRQDFPMIGQVSARTVYDRLQTPNCGGGPVPYEGHNMTYLKTQTAVSTSPQATPVYFVGLASRQTLNYQNCAVANTVGVAHAYDSYGNAVLTTRQNLLGSDGNPVAPAKNVYTLNQYLNDAQNWRLGYLQFSKVSSSNDATQIGIFKPGVDFSLSAQTWDSNGNRLTKAKWDDGNGRFLITSYTYDGFGNRLSTTRPSGARYAVTYDPVYQTFAASGSISPAAGKLLNWSYGYDPRFGKVSVAIDPNGVYRARCYDSFGRLVATQAPYPDNRGRGSFDPSCVSSLVSGIAPPANLLTIRQRRFVTAPGGLPGVTTSILTDWPTQGERSTFLTTQYFDGLWRRNKLVLTNPNENLLIAGQTAYSEHGRVTRHTIPYFQGDSRRYVTNNYDVLGRPVSTSTPFGASDRVVGAKTYVANASGSQVLQTVASGTADAYVSRTDYAYFAGKPRMVQMAAQGIAGTTLYDYDLLGRRTSIQAPPSQDGSRQTYTYAYDSLNRTASKKDSTRGTIGYGYSPAGNLELRTQNGGSFKYSYDLLGRVTEILASDGRSTVYAYDDPTVPFGQHRRASARVLNRGEFESGYRYGYDAQGTLAQVTLTLGDPAATYLTARERDPQGRLRRIVNPDGSVVLRSYGGSRLASVGLTGGPSATFADYSAAGTARKISYGNGTVATYALNVDESPRRIDVTGAGGGTLLSRGFNWNKLGQLLSVSDPGTSSPKILRQYSYSGLRLAKAVEPVTGDSWDFAYDDSGNMTGYGNSTYRYDGTKAVSASGNNGFKASYGGMGNMLTLSPAGQPPQSYAYDLRNQLIEAGIGASIGSTSSQGRAPRYRAVRAGAGAGVTTRYLYDDTGRRIAATSSDGSRTIYVSKWYMDAGAPGAGAGIRVLEANQIPFAQWGEAAGDASQFYLHADHQRSTIMTSGSAGGSLATFAYTPLGQLTTPVSAPPRFLYTGKELDPHGGFYWLGARAYHPAYGRFLKPDDRFGGPPHRPDALNDFAYVLNDPASYLDPSGHSAIGIVGSVACWMTAGALATTAAAKAANPDYAVGFGIAAGAVGTVCGAIGIEQIFADRALNARLGAMELRLTNLEGSGGGGDGGGSSVTASGGGDIFILKNVTNYGADGESQPLGNGADGESQLIGNNFFESSDESSSEIAADAVGGNAVGAPVSLSGGDVAAPAAYGAEGAAAHGSILGTSSVSSVAPVDTVAAASAGMTPSEVAAPVADFAVASTLAHGAETAAATTAAAATAEAATTATASVAVTATAETSAALAIETVLEVAALVLAF